MGRHSSSEQAPFLRSLAGWFLPWVLVAAVAAVAVVVAVSALGQKELAAKPPPAAGAEASPEPSPSSPSTPAKSPKPKPSPTPTAKKTKKPTPTPSEEPTAALITEGITVQVLNATTSPSADDAMAARLEGLGFGVVAIVPASRTYEATTVFWSSTGAQEAGEVLAERFGWLSAPKPANLSETVDLHVVVGLDES
ncbi:hypothetical protein BH24ACT26_BH24ACT26_10190 [soil metagenome]